MSEISEKLPGKVLLKGTMLPLSGEAEDYDSDPEEDGADPKTTEPAKTEDFANLQLIHNLGFLVENNNKNQVKTAVELSDQTHLRAIHFHGYEVAESR